MNTTQATKYLALYTGPGGPISAILDSEDDGASSLEDVVARSAAARWFDEGRCDLDEDVGVDLSLFSAHPEVVIEYAINAGWAIAARGTSSADYDIYIRNAEPRNPSRCSWRRCDSSAAVQR